MAPKRRTTEDDEGSSSEEEGGSGSGSPSPQPAKRARRETNDDDERIRTEREEAEFEEQHIEAMRAAIQNKIKVKGGIAQTGIIKKIEVQNFLCHEYLEVEFGPQINFIIGHNGSGKSAIMSAIAVALGGKATSTGRGTGLKSFIKEGTSVSEVAIWIKNQGPEAYKPKIYGDEIIIARHFTITGSSSYKIKSSKGKIISTKRDELNAITDHMGIQVDNPLTLLTQDLSRQFIASSQASEKYAFFLKGTQLMQLSEEYEVILENITKTETVITQKSEAIPELKQARDEASKKFKEAAAAAEQSKIVEKLTVELAWSHVAAKQDEFAAKTDQVATAEARIPKYQEKLDEATATLKAEEDNIAELERCITDPDGEDRVTVNALVEERATISKSVKEIRQDLSDLRDSQAQINESVRICDEEISGYERTILDEERKLQDHQQGKRERIQRAIADLGTNIATGEARLSVLSEEIVQSDYTAQQANADRQSKDQEISRLRRELDDARTTRQNLNGTLANKYNAFGKDIPNLIKMVNAERWAGETPIGPLGVYVDLKERKWAYPARVAVQGHMSSWVISTTADRPKLVAMLRKTGNANASIIVSGRDIFDYSQGLPPPGFTTVLDILDIKDEFVKRVLINTAHIENTCLAETREEADNTLQQTRTFFRFMTLQGLNVVRFREGGGSTTTMTKENHTNKALFSGSETEIRQQLADVEMRGTQITAQIHTLNDQMVAAKNQADACSRASAKAKRNHRDLEVAIRQEKQKLEQLRDEANEEAPANIGALQEMKRGKEKEREVYKAEFQGLLAEEPKLNAKTVPLMARSAEIKRELERLESKKRALQTQAEEAVERRVQYQTNVKHWKGRLDAAKAELKTFEEQASVLQEEYQNWKATAEQKFGDEYPNPRAPHIVDSERNKLKAALRQKERALGASVEVLSAAVTHTQAMYDAAKGDFEQLQALNRGLKSSLQLRMDKWADFRRHIALRCKVQFSFHLAQRGFYGKVIFDHQKGTLNLKVQTDDQMSTVNRDKDPKSLSGGEKSFATICLLLSLWESMGCPIRCLDEFDVFMDAVNRRMSMSMMLETAKASEGRQYILITPLDISNVARSEEVKIYKMHDPRSVDPGQTTLPFGRK